jgi:hypothetical protein
LADTYTLFVVVLEKKAVVVVLRKMDNYWTDLRIAVDDAVYF